MFNLENYRNRIWNDRTYLNKRVIVNNNSEFTFESEERLWGFSLIATVKCYVVNGYGQLDITFAFTNTERYDERVFELKLFDIDLDLRWYLSSTFGNKNNAFNVTRTRVNGRSLYALKYCDYKNATELKEDNQAINAAIDAYNCCMNTRVISFVGNIVEKLSK